MHGVVKSARNIVILILCLVLSGCIGARFVYNQLDWFTVFYVSGLFDLDKEQKEDLRATVDGHFQWHREHQLPQYAAFCRDLDEQMGGTITPEMLELRYQKMLVIWDEFMVYTMPDAAAFLLSLRDEQIDDFLANVEEDNEELRDEYGGRSLEERLERREKAAIKGIQRVTGRLNEDQKELIRSYMGTLHDNSEEWLKRRRQWQTDFRDLLQSRPPEPEFSARLNKLMLEPNADDGEEYRRKVDENRQIIFEMISALSGQLTDKQRKRVRNRLQGYAEDFEYLAERV